MISVLVVDDSAFMRRAISTMLDNDPEIEVVGVAHNGEEALEKVRELNPDVVTMDIEMPRMDGLTALRHIMMEMPRPVIMISSLTNEGAEATLKAMELGAVDFIPKQLSKVSLQIIKIEEELQQKVKTVARRKVRSPMAARVRRTAQDKVVTVPKADRRTQVRDIVAIGVSTGGPPAVQKLLSMLPEKFPACILIAQHMPKAFTGPFAKRLNDTCAITVKEAEAGDRVKDGVVFIAPGGSHLSITQRVTHIDVTVSQEPRDSLYKPSANVLISSVAEGVGRRGLGIILTGMGSDGLEGIRALKERGGKALAQSDSTCVVYGMPKAIVQNGLADGVVDIEDMAVEITNSLYN